MRRLLGIAPSGSTDASRKSDVDAAAALIGVVKATIDPYYSSGPVTVTVDSTGATLTGLSWVSTYTPMAGDGVLVSPWVGATNIILGSPTNKLAFPNTLTVPLASPYTSFGDPAWYVTPTIEKSPSGVVKVHGMFYYNTAGNGSLITTLPVGYRPAQTMSFPTGSSGGNGSGRFDVTTDGKVTFIASQASPSSWIAIENIIFPTRTDLTWVTPALQNGWTAVTGRVPQYAVDTTAGVIWHRGAATSGTVADGTLIFQSANQSGGQYQHHAIAQDGRAMAIGFGTTGQVVAKGGSGTYYFDALQVGIASGTGALTFTNPALSNATADSGFQTISYAKSSDGVVVMRGFGRTVTQNTTVYTLPVGYRPRKQVMMCTIGNGNGAGTSAEIQIYADGTVRISDTPNSDWVSFEGRFLAEQ